MARVISISNRKGGSGKTTTSVNLAAALAHKGKRLLLVDADPQAHSALSLGIGIGNASPDLRDVLEGDCDIMEAARPTYLKKLQVIPGGNRLSGYGANNGDRSQLRTALRTQLTPLQNSFDYIVIDTPPALGLMTVGALVASTEVLVPMQAHFLAMEGLGEIISVLQRLRRHYGVSAELLGIVPTFFQAQQKLARAIVRDITARLGERTVLHPIRNSIALAEAPSHGRSIFQHRLRSNGAYDYLMLANQIDTLASGIKNAEG